jgi:hypothetical protein
MAFRTPFPTIKPTAEPDTTIGKFKTPFPGGTSIVKQVEYQPTPLKVSTKDVLKETILAGKSVFDMLISIPKGIYEAITKPSEFEQQVEKKLIPEKTTILNVIPKTIGQGFIRLFEPMLEPLGKDVGEIIATNELTKQIDAGKLPVEVLDDIEVLKKTAPQIVGDTAMAVLAAYIPSFGKAALGKGTMEIGKRIISGTIKGAEAGTLFGVAQVLASGTKNVKEIANIMATNIIGISAIGGATGGLGGIISKIRKVETQVKSEPIKEILSNVRMEVETKIKSQKIRITRKEFETQIKNNIEMQTRWNKMTETEKNEWFKRMTFPETTPKPIPEAKKPIQEAILPEKGIITKEKAIKPKTTPKAEKITYEPLIKQSTLGKKVRSKAIKEKLIYGFDKTFRDLPEYEKMNVKEQGQKAVEFTLNNLDEAVEVAMGRKAPPEGILPESIFKVVEDMAHQEKNIDLIRDLATKSELVSEATTMGQRIRMLAEREPDSAVAKIRELKKAKEIESRKRYKKTTDDIVGEIKSKRKPIVRETWNSFIDSITC